MYGKSRQEKGETHIEYLHYRAMVCGAMTCSEIPNGKPEESPGDNLEVWKGPTFKEISDPRNAFFDRDWFETDLVPEDSPWFSIAGDFLFAKFSINRILKTSKEKLKFRGLSLTKRPKSLADQTSLALHQAKDMLPVIEECIRYKNEDAEFLRIWGEFQHNLGTASAKHAELRKRESRGEFDRGTEARKTWYALWVVKGGMRNRPQHNQDIARVVEKMKTGVIAIPSGFELKWFEKILHKESKLNAPALALTYTREMGRKELQSRATSEHTFSIPPIGLKAYQENSSS